jgi:hypothetical protein
MAAPELAPSRIGLPPKQWTGGIQAPNLNAGKSVAEFEQKEPFIPVPLLKGTSGSLAWTERLPQERLSSTDFALLNNKLLPTVRLLGAHHVKVIALDNNRFLLQIERSGGAAWEGLFRGMYSEKDQARAQDKTFLMGPFSADQLLAHGANQAFVQTGSNKKQLISWLEPEKHYQDRCLGSVSTYALARKLRDLHRSAQEESSTEKEQTPWNSLSEFGAGDRSERPFFRAGSLSEQYLAAPLWQNRNFSALGSRPLEGLTSFASQQSRNIQSAETYRRPVPAKVIAEIAQRLSAPDGDSIQKDFFPRRSEEVPSLIVSSGEFGRFEPGVARKLHRLGASQVRIEAIPEGYLFTAAQPPRTGLKEGKTSESPASFTVLRTASIEILKLSDEEKAAEAAAEEKRLKRELTQAVEGARSQATALITCKQNSFSSLGNDLADMLSSLGMTKIELRTISGGYQVRASFDPNELSEQQAQALADYHLKLEPDISFTIKRQSGSILIKNFKGASLVQSTPIKDIVIALPDITLKPNSSVSTSSKIANGIIATISAASSDVEQGLSGAHENAAFVMDSFDSLKQRLGDIAAAQAEKRFVAENRPPERVAQRTSNNAAVPFMGLIMPFANTR